MQLDPNRQAHQQQVHMAKRRDAGFCSLRQDKPIMNTIALLDNLDKLMPELELLCGQESISEAELV